MRDLRMNDKGESTFLLTMEDYTIILNALHYYKKAEKRENFEQYDAERINKLRDKMAVQLVNDAWDELPSWRRNLL